MNQVTKGSRVAELLTALPALLDIGFSKEDIAVKVFAGLGPEQFRLFMESTEIDINISKHITVPWLVDYGGRKTSMLSFIIATGAYTVGELVSRYKKADLKKAVTIMLKNPERFGVKLSYGWAVAKLIGMNVDNWRAAAAATMSAWARTAYYERSTAYCRMAGRGPALVDMLFDTALSDSQLNSAYARMNITEAKYLVEHYGITPRATLSLSYQPEVALWLTKRFDDPYWSYELGARLGTRERTATTKADDYDECMRWGRMCIERYGIATVSNSMGNEDEATIMDYFYNAKHEEDAV